MASTTSPITAPSGTGAVAALIKRVTGDYVVRRILKAFVLVFASATLTFFVIRLMPSNPIDVFINQQVAEFGMSPDEARTLAASLFSIDVDEPLLSQYMSYLKNMSNGDLGMSMTSRGTKVTSMIAKFLPWTLFSVGTALVISFTLGILLGMLIAYRRNSWLDHALSGVASLVSAIPNYLIAILLIVFLGVYWKILPIHAMRGSMTPGIQPGFTFVFIKDIFFHALLPITTYVLTTIGSWMLIMKSSTIATLEEDYVAVARARGLSDARITLAYVGRNAMLPLFTQLTVSIGFIRGRLVPDRVDLRLPGHRPNSWQLPRPA